ncbi:MAG: cache domain-containing protein [Syntrophobacteraceae bacterium]|jgi:signal transduction histidine kinase
MSPRKQSIKTRRDAINYVDMAVDFYKAAGKEVAFAEFTNPEGRFVDGDMYVYALNMKGTMLAHGANERFVGQEWIDVKDSGGKPFVKEILEIAELKGSGWVEYKWYDLEVRDTLPKAVYFEKVDDVIICSGVYPRQSKRTRRDAMNWVSRAVDFYNAAGKGISLAEFTNPKGEFVDGEMYIFALDTKGTMVAHGANRSFVGTQWIEVKDPDGKPFVKEILDAAHQKGNGWVEYSWYDPEIKETLPKAVYFEKVDDVIICSGVYKQ